MRVEELEKGLEKAEWSSSCEKKARSQNQKRSRSEGPEQELEKAGQSDSCAKEVDMSGKEVAQLRQQLSSTQARFKLD